MEIVWDRDLNDLQPHSLRATGKRRWRLFEASLAIMRLRLVEKISFNTNIDFYKPMKVLLDSELSSTCSFFSESELWSLLDVLCTWATISSSFWRCFRGREDIFVLISKGSHIIQIDFRARAHLFVCIVVSGVDKHCHPRKGCNMVKGDN